mmetsp:Transcript_33244/g.43766  ORF Transcript_33244/g.43766 Transcript_33244/m.43766 type:complete len:85 (-) Transcript_33244:1187-1441(-)|eukprot:CAMPEP_0185584694 /NCGR_PEP_ID=MMETSP0434-20130131/33773_1 /TAXON_ID=626734 ORGANISM="Favella taraikaensis, Strain Fe Narragansett Bay" /NCGR_SAMPLE_ID=MMETSP0434 /ASSEMBLY_ACC=CAM_ASM_000379 /LENGTH=84 /DNA_ID=CAMNT_0028204611 /DNA_START=1145 /DNA_END=1399 /DNA_ORIENTATION=+
MTVEEQKILESLKQNEFLPKMTFDDFLSKKMSKGKRTLFLNRGTGEDARAFMKEYMQQSQAKAEAAAEQRLNKIEQERVDNQKN